MVDDSPHPEIGLAPSQPVDSNPLEHVVDDREAKVAWGEWAVEEMTKGRCAEELIAELTANGWDEDDAAELAENARRQTRHLRGVITRDDVARQNAARYHKATGQGFLSMLRFVSVFYLGMYCLRQVLHSLAFLRGSRRHKPLTPGFPVQLSSGEQEMRSDNVTVESDESSG
jgi:hypothetical protein